MQPSLAQQNSRVKSALGLLCNNYIRLWWLVTMAIWICKQYKVFHFRPTATPLSQLLLKYTKNIGLQYWYTYVFRIDNLHVISLKDCFYNWWCWDNLRILSNIYDKATNHTTHPRYQVWGVRICGASIFAFKYPFPFKYPFVAKPLLKKKIKK